MGVDWLLSGLYRGLPANIRTVVEGARKVAPFQTFFLFLTFVLILTFLAVFAALLAVTQALPLLLTLAILIAILVLAFLATGGYLAVRLRDIEKAATEERLQELSSPPSADPKGGLPQDCFQRAHSYLQGMIDNASLRLGIDKGNLRANVFMPSGDYLSICPGLHLNMDRQDELTIHMPVGYGATGHAFQSKSPVIAIYKEGWGKYQLDDQETRKIHPDLRWIHSMPIGHARQPNQYVGVANVDCLNVSLSQEEVEKLTVDMFYWAGLLSQELSR